MEGRVNLVPPLLAFAPPLNALTLCSPVPIKFFKFGANTRTTYFARSTPEQLGMWWHILHSRVFMSFPVFIDFSFSYSSLVHIFDVHLPPEIFELRGERWFLYTVSMYNH